MVFLLPGEAAMSFALTMDQELIRRTVREFADKELEPKSAELDLHSRFPAENIRKMAPLGLLGLIIPAEEGGSGGDTVSFCLAAEECARACASSAFEMVIANALIALPLSQTAPVGLKGEWLPRIIAGEAVGACAVAEEGIGKAGIRTTAKATKSGFVLNGSKHFVANATEAHMFLVSAREGDQTSLFLVPKAAKGVHIGRNPSTLGLRPIPLADVHFSDTLVPADHKLAEGKAEAFADAWQLGKLGSGAISVGIAQAALERAIQFAQQRNQFGRPIAQFEAIQHYIAEMELETKAARALVLTAAGSRDDSKEWQPEAHAARLFAAQTATKVTKLSIRVHGGAGYMRELPVERYARDARTINHFGETLDAARTVLGKRLLGLP